MLRTLLQRLAGMVREVRQRFQKAPGHTGTKSASKKSNAKIASTKGQRPGNRPKNPPRGRTVKKR